MCKVLMTLLIIDGKYKNKTVAIDIRAMARRFGNKMKFVVDFVWNSVWNLLNDYYNLESF